MYGMNTEAQDFVSPYVQFSAIHPPIFDDNGMLVQVLSSPFMLIELMEADYLCIDIKHDVIITAEYGKLHHFTVVKWSDTLDRSLVVGRGLINGMTREILGDALIALFSAAERATGIKVNFMRQSTFRGFMLDFAQAELGALFDLLQHFHPKEDTETINSQLARMVKGCKFHWLQQVERTSKSLERDPEKVERIKARFVGLADTDDQRKVISAMNDHLREYPEAKDWVQFWMRKPVRRMVFRAFSQLSNWDNLPSTNNICEAQHSILRLECTSKSYAQVVTNLWECDSGAFHLLAASNVGVPTKWRDSAAAARREGMRKLLKRYRRERDAANKGRPPDTAAEYHKVRERLNATAQKRSAGAIEFVVDLEKGGVKQVDTVTDIAGTHTEIGTCTGTPTVAGIVTDTADEHMGTLTVASTVADTAGTCTRTLTVTDTMTDAADMRIGTLTVTDIVTGTCDKVTVSGTAVGTGKFFFFLFFN